MRIRGRTIRPSNLAERRLMTALGVDRIKVPRGANVYVVARRFGRAARCESPDHLFIRDVIQRSATRLTEPKPSPEPDTREPVGDEADLGRAAAE